MKQISESKMSSNFVKSRALVVLRRSRFRFIKTIGKNVSTEIDLKSHILWRHPSLSGYICPGVHTCRNFRFDPNSKTQIPSLNQNL